MSNEEPWYRYVPQDSPWFGDLRSGGGGPGEDGREVELRAGSTHIQWRYQGESTWRDLIALSALKGEKGDKGDQGDEGPQGPPGVGLNTWATGDPVPDPIPEGLWWIRLGPEDPVPGWVPGPALVTRTEE